MENPPTPRCLVWQWGRFGGGPRYALELSQALRAHCGFETRLSLASGSEILAHPDLRVLNDYPVDTYDNRLEFILRTLTVQRALTSLKRGIDAFRPLVAINTMPAYWDYFLYRHLARRGISVISIIHDATLHPGDSFYFADAMNRHHLHRSAAIVTLSDFVARRLRERAILGNTPQHTIPHVAFDMPELKLARPGPPQYPFRQPLHLLMAGRLKTYKGLSLLTDALDRVPAERIIVRIAGAAQDHDALEALASRSNVELELGWMSDEQFIANLDWADAILLPYIEASQSGVIPLAFRRGRPVITTPVGGLPEQVAHGVNGLVTVEMSGAAVAEAIMHFAEAPDALQACALGALASAENELNWAAIAPKFAGVIQAAAGQSASR